jgi:hypothetical protein
MAQIEFLEAEGRMDSNYLELGLSKSGIFTPTCGRLNGKSDGNSLEWGQVTGAGGTKC